MGEISKVQLPDESVRNLKDNYARSELINKQKVIYQGSVAPQNPQVGDLWIDDNGGIQHYEGEVE